MLLILMLSKHYEYCPPLQYRGTDAEKALFPFAKLRTEAGEVVCRPSSFSVSKKHKPKAFSWVHTEGRLLEQGA